MNGQFPHAIEEKRKQLYLIIRGLRSHENRTKLMKNQTHHTNFNHWTLTYDTMLKYSPINPHILMDYL